MTTLYIPAPPNPRAAMELLPLLKPQLGAAVWNDQTRWPQLLSSPVKTEQHYLERGLKAPVDVVSRAAAAAALVERVENPSSAVVAPLRAGPVATDSLAAFRQLLHAAMAGHHASAVVAATDVGAAMSSAGTAWRHLEEAGPWLHEEHLRPPQLAAPFRRALQLAVLLLTYERRSAMPLAVCDEALHRQRIELLQAAVACNGPPAVRRWAMPLLKEAVSEFWATHHHDPRTRGAERSERNACAVLRAMGPPATRKVEHFIQMHQAVHGYSGSSPPPCDPDALLLSTLPTSAIIDAALPLEALAGSVELPGVRQFQQVGLLDPPEHAQPIVADGGVVMLARDADRCNRQPSTFSLRMPTGWFRAAAGGGKQAAAPVAKGVAAELEGLTLV